MSRPALKSQTSSSGRLVLAGAIGNTLEWYDFAAYGYMASIIGRNFFPSSDPFVSLMAAFGVFAAAFLIRPFGGALFGHVGDRFGRKRVLTLSAGMMALSTFVIGVLPTYAEVGAVAPVLLILLRLLQGLSVGGEHATSAIFLVERSKPGRRGLFGSFAVVAVTGGTLLGSAVGAIIATSLSPAALEEWGWRIPFLLGIMLGGVSLYLRRSIPDDHEVSKQSARLPLVEAFRTDWRGIVRGFAMAMAPGVGFYIVFIYLTTYMQRVDRMPAAEALRINTVSMAIMLLCTPMFAILSDRIGRKVVLAGSLVGLILLSWPLFRMLASGETSLMILGQIGFVVLLAAYSGPMPAAFVEMFARPIRCSAMSVSFNAGMGLVGGTAPTVAVYLVNREHEDMGPAFYLMAIAAVSLLGVLTWRASPGQDLAKASP